MASASFLDAAKHSAPARAVSREGHEASNPRRRGRAYRARGAHNWDLIDRTHDTHFETTIGVVVGGIGGGDRGRRPRMAAVARCVSTRSACWSHVHAVDRLDRKSVV